MNWVVSALNQRILLTHQLVSVFNINYINSSGHSTE